MLSLVLAAALWGSSFPIITYALRDISPLLLLVLRFFTAFLILLPPRDLLGKIRGVFRRDFFFISIANALAFILQFKAQELTTASKTALFVNSSPVFVVLISWLYLHDRFTVRQLAAMVIALSGVVVTSTRLDFAGFGTVNPGDVLCMGVGIVWALFIILSKKVVGKHEPVALARAIYFWTAVLTLPLVAFEDVRMTPVSIVPMIYLAVFTTVFAYHFYLKGVRSVSALATSVVILIEIVVAFVISFYLLGEAFDFVETIGVLLVITGVLMVVQRPRVPKTGESDTA